MFEERTFEAIRDEILELIPDTLDKREGSVIYSATVYIAPKMAELYSYLDVFMNLVFADTVVGENLTRLAAQFGVYRKTATSSVRYAVIEDTTGERLDVPIGSRFTIDDLLFTAISRSSPGYYLLQAEQTGTESNNVMGELLPLEPIENLGSVTFANVQTPAIDDESDESLRNRLTIRVQKQATSGNAFHYEQWALSVPGVGGAKVIPLWNGPNTVKVILLSEERTPVNGSIVIAARDLIESERPIGAEVSVVSAATKLINVTASLTLAPGATLGDVIAQFNEGLEEYLSSVAFVTNEVTGEPELIRYTRIANILLDLPPIIDFTNLVVNGGTANIQPTFEEVGVAGVVDFT